MFRFKDDNLASITKTYTFQYILCFGSRFKCLNIKRINNSFNTSYVSVQGILKYLMHSSKICFNTSYVSVQELDYFYSLIEAFRGFNTSYVSVQEEITKEALEVSYPLFQYILCFGSSMKMMQNCIDR